MTSAMEVVPVLAAKLPPPEFVPLFQKLHRALMLKLCQPSHPDEIRASCVGGRMLSICLHAFASRSSRHYWTVQLVLGCDTQADSST